MNDILNIHNEAMNLASMGDKVLKTGDANKAKALYAEAFEKERGVLNKLDDSNSSLIGRTVILRSAATLALQCGQKREAERLIAKGLSEDLPESLTMELRELLQEVYEDEIDDTKSVCKITLPNTDKSYLTSIISSKGWIANFRKIAVL